MRCGRILAESRLLQALPAALRARLTATMQPVGLRLGDVVCERDTRAEHVYFPTDCVASLVSTMADGRTSDIGLIGNEGMIRLTGVLGGETGPTATVIQVAGGAMRMGARDLKAEFQRAGELQRALLRYTQALIAQVSQTSACHRLHPVDQRLCCWLLLIRDRVATAELHLTQDRIAHMLGVRRECVAMAAVRIQDAGLISYVRGRIRLHDRSGLEARTCECYRVVRDEYARLLDL
jgi:CRP-like cAMP-binding protein